MTRDELRAAAIADYLTGMSMEQVAATRNIPRATVCRWIKLAGVSRPRTKGRACSVPECDQKHLARGYCRQHYGRLIRGLEPRGTWEKFVPADRLEDCRWMAEGGETLTGAAKRLGLTRKGLEAWLRDNDPDTLRVLAERDWWPRESRATFHGVAS
jgi:transposase-like protein